MSDNPRDYSEIRYFLDQVGAGKEATARLERVKRQVDLIKVAIRDGASQASILDALNMINNEAATAVGVLDEKIIAPGTAVLESVGLAVTIVQFSCGTAVALASGTAMDSDMSESGTAVASASGTAIDSDTSGI